MTRNVHLVATRDVAYDLPRGLVVFARDLLAGHDVATLLADNGPLAASVAVRLIAQVCDGVASMHAIDLVHRNLKPSNVLLAEDDAGRITARVCDPAVGWGSTARARAASWEHLRYEAPEVASISKDGSRDVDRRADVYSLGALLHALITGAPPHADVASADALMEALASRDVPAVQSRASWVPGAIAHVVDQALSRDPGRRFASAQTLGSALRELAGGDDSVVREELVPLPASLRKTKAAPSSRRPPASPSVDAPPAVARDPLLGHRLGGRYRVLRAIGRGGMGVVYEVEGANGERFAAKVISRDSSGRDTQLIARFIREAHAVTKVDDVHVTRTIELGTDMTLGAPFLVMELLHGQDLGSLYRDRGAVEPLPLLRVFVQAATGLAAAHEQGIVHRDIKPANIFLHAAPDGAITVKICDFGVAKALQQAEEEGGGSNDLTRTGGVLGTPMYMSPEHASNPRAIDARADIWSLCASLYEGLSGQRLWESESSTLAELMLAICTRPFRPLAEAAPWVSQPIAEIVEKGLARAPADRWPDLDAMIAALNVHLDGVTAVTQPPADAHAVPPEIAILAHQATQPALSGSEAGVTAPPSHATAADSPGPGPRGLVRRLGALGIAAVGASVILGSALYVRTRPRSSAAVAAAVSPTTDAASPASPVAGATEAYRRGVEALRDSRREPAVRELDAALKLDPQFAAAHLRRAMAQFPMPNREQEHLREAIRLRGSLGAHDRILVDALAPLVNLPQDIPETEKRLARAVADAPDDPDFTLQLCRTQKDLGEYEKARDTCTRARALDPGAAAPMMVSAVVSLRLDDVPSALASFDACLHASPLATSCLSTLVQVQALDGRCEDALVSGRHLVADDPSSPRAYGLLASLLAGAAQPAESVRVALDEESARVDAADGLVAKLWNPAAFAIFSGDFTGADRRLREWTDSVAKSRSEDDHRDVARLRILLAQEEGDSKTAGALAANYLAQRPAWLGIAGEDSSVFFFIGQLYRSGVIARPEFVARRDAWLAGKRAEPKGAALGSRLGFAWIAAYAAPAVTAADAEEALDALPSYLPLPDPSMRMPQYEQPIGHVYLLANREREALPFLRRAANGCLPLLGPFEAVLASLELGLAEERLGEIPAACEAYRAVTAHWGASISQSARRARARALALHCGP